MLASMFMLLKVHQGLIGGGWRVQYAPNSKISSSYFKGNLIFQTPEASNTWSHYHAPATPQHSCAFSPERAH